MKASRGRWDRARGRRLSRRGGAFSRRAGGAAPGRGEAERTPPRGLSADGQAVSEADDDALVTTLAAVCPFDPIEKQALLEAPNLPARADMLNALMTFAQGPGGDTPTRQ